MIHAGDVSSEGGPFLIADAKAIRAWQPTEASYTALCRAIEASGSSWGIPWPVGGLQAVAWESDGPGTAEVFVQANGGLLLLRGWFDGDWEAGTREAAERARADVRPVGDVEVPSGVIAILWSPEDGRCVRDRDLLAGTGRPPGKLGVDGSSLLVRVTPGRFKSAADRVEIAAGEAVRCFLDPA